MSLGKAYILMTDQKPFTGAKRSIKKWLIKKAAERLHSGKPAVKDVDNVLLLNNTIAKRCALLA